MLQVLPHVDQGHAGHALDEQVRSELHLALHRLGQHLPHLLFHLRVEQFRLLRQFGDKAQVVDNEDGVVLDHNLEQGNPPDAPQLAPAVERIIERTGRKATDGHR